MRVWVPDGLGMSEAEVEALAEAERARLFVYRAKVSERAKKFATTSLSDAIAQWQEWEDTPIEQAITTGWDGIDQSLGRPIGAGEVIVIGARTGVGKTLLATHLTLGKVSSDDKAQAVMLNMEMSNEQMAHRIVAHVLGISPDMASESSKAGLLESDGSLFLQRYAPWAKRIEFYPHPGAKVEHIPGVLESVAAKTGNDPTIVVVDYMQLLGGEGTEYQRTSQNAKMLKQIAMEHNVTIMTCVQLSRGGRAGEVKPSLNDLRDSGVIEEAADRVFLFWRDEDSSPRIYGQVAKNRHGKNGATCTLEMDDALRIRELADAEVYGTS